MADRTGPAACFVPPAQRAADPESPHQKRFLSKEMEDPATLGPLTPTATAG